MNTDDADRAKIKRCAGVVSEREGGGAKSGERAHQRFLTKSRMLRPAEAQWEGGFGVLKCHILECPHVTTQVGVR